MASPERTSFGDVIHSGDLDLIIDRLDADSVDLDGGDENCNLETPLMRLCHSELEDDDAAAILELMLLKRPYINKQDNEGRTTLCHACMSGQMNIIQRLGIIGDCDPNIPDSYGNTALMFGVYFGDLNIVQMLIESFAGGGREVDIMKENHEGINAILIANQNGFYEIADFLEQNASEQIEKIQNVSSVSMNDDQDHHSYTTSQQNVGTKAHNFRLRKLKPAVVGPPLGPLVVSNRLQSSKSVDYVQYYKEPSEEDHEKEVVKRQYSYSAVSSHKNQESYDVTGKLLYQTEQYDDQYMAEDEEESSISSGDDVTVRKRVSGSKHCRKERTGDKENRQQDEGYGENPHPAQSRGRRPSVSLPDLRRKQTTSRGSMVTTFSCCTGGEDSGYDARSGMFTLTREDLSLPELPEPGSSSNDEDYTPRTRRDSISLPDLRGLRRCLVGSPSSTATKAPVLNAKDIQNATLVDLRHRNVIPGSQEELSDDVFETICIDTDRSKKKSGSKNNLTLPSLTDTNKTATPRTINEPKGLKTNRTKAWGTPRPNNTPRGTTMAELNKKITRRQKLLMDRA